MIEKPKDEGAMFFTGYKFHPGVELKQSELNRIVVHLFRRLFVDPDGKPLEVKENDKSMITLVQFLVDLDMRLNQEAFDDFPEELKKHFMVINRDGQNYRYGRKPRLL